MLSDVLDAVCMETSTHVSLPLFVTMMFGLCNSSNIPPILGMSVYVTQNCSYMNNTM